MPLGREVGAAWSERAVQDGRRVIERRFAQQGYLAADVEARSDRRDGVADVTYRVTAGPQTRVGRVLVGGLVQTREDVVRRELPFQPGDPFNPEALVDAQRRLGEIPVFERVDVEPLRPPPAPFADVTVTARERKRRPAQRVKKTSSGLEKLSRGRRPDAG